MKAMGGKARVTSPRVSKGSLDISAIPSGRFLARLAHLR
jgi:hypothetical protein